MLYVRSHSTEHVYGKVVESSDNPYKSVLNFRIYFIEKRGFVFQEYTYLH